MSRSINKTNNGIVHVTTFGDITLDSLNMSQFQKAGTITAQLRQIVMTKSSYPSKKTETSMQQNLFDNSEFGFTSQDFINSENRIAFLDVPVNSTEEEIKKRLAIINAQGGTIYRIMSNHPILDENQKFAVQTGLNGVTLDTFAKSQVVRFPTGHPKEGQLCLDANNKVQYRITKFWKTPLGDQDLRSTDPVDVYLSPEIQLELSGIPASSVIEADVMQGQTL